MTKQLRQLTLVSSSHLPGTIHRQGTLAADTGEQFRPPRHYSQAGDSGSRNRKVDAQHKNAPAIKILKLFLLFIMP